MSVSTTTSWSAALRDLYPRPGERIKQWVVELRRELAWERETCPRIAVPQHDDNTNASCRNVGSTPWTYLDHDCCYTCGDLHEATASRADVAAWRALKEDRAPITGDREALSDEVQPALEFRQHPLFAMTRHS